MIVKENLVGLCTTFRNVFLMGRGEFWVDFVDAVEEIKGRVSLRRTSLSEFGNVCPYACAYLIF